MNVADVKNQVEQKSFCQTLLGEETDSIKTVIAFMDTHLKALSSANKWVLEMSLGTKSVPQPVK